MTDHVVCQELWIFHPLHVARGEYGNLGGQRVRNDPCGLECPVLEEAEVMDFRCRRGHRFYAQPKDIVRANSDNP